MKPPNDDARGAERPRWPAGAGRLGVDLGTVAAGLVVLLLSWVGLTTHQSAGELRELSAKFDAWARQVEMNRAALESARRLNQDLRERLIVLEHAGRGDAE